MTEHNKSTYHTIQHAEEAVEHLREHPRFKVEMNAHDIFDYDMSVELMPDVSPVDVQGALDMLDRGDWQAINCDSGGHTWKFTWSKDNLL